MSTYFKFFFLAYWVLGFWGLTQEVAQAKVPAAASPKAFSLSSVCESIVNRSVFYTTQDIQGAPGLKILHTGTVRNYDYADLVQRGGGGLFYLHELISSAQYARRIHETRGETLLLVPKMDGINIPGFDGVILNAHGKAIANYSLKTILTSKRKDAIKSPYRHAVGALDQFSTLESVVKFFLVRPSDAANDLWKYKKRSALNRLSNHQGFGVEEWKDWLATAAHIFGLSTQLESFRLTRLVIDISSENQLLFPNEEKLKTIQKWARKNGHLLESITVMKGRRIAELR